MLTLQNPDPNSPHGLCGRKAILNWNLAKYHSITTRMHSAEKPKQPEANMVNVKRFVIERAVHFLTISEEDFPRKCYCFHELFPVF